MSTSQDMESDEEVKAKLFAALLGEPNAQRMAQFSKELSRRKFEQIDVGTAALAVLSGAYFSQIRKELKPPSYASVTSANNKLLVYGLSLLTHCGSHYSPALHLINSLCSSSTDTTPSFLTSDDIALLQEVIKQTSHALDTEEEGVDGAVQGESAATQEDLPARAESPLVDTRVQVQKMYSHMIRRSPGGVHQLEKPPSVSVSPMKLTIQGDELLKNAMSHFEEIGGEKQLIDFCLSLPVFEKFAASKATFLTPKGGGEKMIIARLLQLKCAVEAVSIAVNLTTLSSPAVLRDLTSLLLKCLSAACIATSSFSSMSSSTKRSPSAQKDDTTAKTEEDLPTTVESLFSRLSCSCSLSPPSSSSSSFIIVKMLVNEIVATVVLKTTVLMETMLKDSKNIDTFRTLVGYNVLTDLLQLLSAKTVTDTSRSLWMIKMTMPLGQLLYCALKMVSSVLKQGEQEEGGDSDTLSVADIDVTKTYSYSQLSNVLLQNLPLVNILVSVMMGSFKKTTSLINSPSRDDSQSELGPLFSSIKPGRSEKEEQIFRRVKFALSEKISEKMSKETTKESESSDAAQSPSRSPSPSSTLSSSGEVQGEYVVNPAEGDNGSEDMELAEEEEGEEEEEEDAEEDDESDDYYPAPSLDPFLRHLYNLTHAAASAAASRSTPPPPPPPPPHATIPAPPPLPPKLSKPPPFRKTRFALPQDTPVRPKTPEISSKPSFYQELALLALQCLQNGLVHNSVEKIRSYLHGKLTPDHISALASMFLNVHTIAQSNDRTDKFSKVTCFEKFVTIVTELLHQLVVEGYVKAEHHGMMLRDMGLHQGCWSLSVIPKVLSLLARVLICRLQVMGDQEDPLSLSIWKGFLTTLEDNAVNENEPDEDLDVTHLQLLLFVWHNFSLETRKKLLLQCVTAVVKVAEEKRSGVVVPPVPVCRLLLVLDYMLFQFSELDPELVKQVTQNLLQDGEGSVSPILSPQPPNANQSSSPVVCYPCDHQLQYQRIMSKPGSTANNKNDKEEHAGVFPCFYNVRCQKSEGGIDKTIDAEACGCVLALSEAGEHSYEMFHDALILLMSCGASYKLYSDILQQRVMSVCAGHHSFNLCLGMLTHLPPSFSTLTAIVDSSSLTCKDQQGACLVMFALIFSIKLRLQHLDMEDIVETLTVMGHNLDEAEDLVKRVVAVVDSTDHFILQTIPLLKEFCSVDVESMLPLLSITSVDLLLCLLQRALQSVIDDGEEDEEEEEEEEEKAKKSEEEEKKEKQVKDEKENEKDNKDTTQEEKLYDTYAEQLIPLLLNVASKLTAFSHMYVCSDIFHQPRQIAEEMETVVSRLISISSKKYVSVYKIPQSLFYRHIPEATQERLKFWNQALLIDREHKQILSVPDSDNLNLIEELRSFLDLSYTAFAGHKTFDPARLLKSAMFTLSSVLLFLLELHPKKSISKYLSGVIPLATDPTYEFLANESLQGQIAELADATLTDTSFSQECVRHIVKESFSLIVCPAISGHTFQGTVLEDVFGLLSALLDCSDEGPVLASIMDEHSDTNVITLVLLGAMSSVSSLAVTDGVKFLVHVLQQANKSQEKHLEVLCRQINTLAVAPSDQIHKWLRRLVIGCVNDCADDVLEQSKLLFKFADLLIKEESPVDNMVCHRLLTTLIPLGSELVAALPKEPHLLPVFREFFRCCTVLAWRQAEEGHLVLARSAVCWLPDCTSLVKDCNWEQKPDVLLPVSTLLSYLSSLTSAVQLSTNTAICTKRRNLACEDDSSYLEGDADGEDDEEVVEEYQSDTDDEGLNEQLCTFTETRREFRNQHWYHCHTCKLIDGTGCCSVCVKVCHKDHDVTYSKFGSFFCDCGVKDDGSCKALVKRTGGKSEGGDSRGGSPVPSDGAPFEEKRKRRIKRRKERSKSKKSDSKKKHRDHTTSSALSFPTTSIQKLSKLIESYKFKLKEFLDSSSVIVGRVLEVVSEVLPNVVSSKEEQSGGGAALALTALRNLHTKEKKTERVDHLMSTSVGCQEGALENVRMNLSGDQNQALRLLMSSGAVRRSAMCCLSSSRGQKQHLVVSHDKGKLTILQLSSLLKQADSNRRKLTLIRLSTTTVPFTVLSVCSNPCSEQHFAVCGLRECVVLTVSPQGQVSDRLLLHPSVDTSGYIVKALWVPGSQTEIALVTDTFVKMYDLSLDAISPSYYYIVCSGKIKDACILVVDNTKLVAVMTTSGHIFFHPISPEFSASEGPVYFTVEFTAHHSNITTKDDKVCDGGASVYYSHALKMLFFSYQNGKSYMASIIDDLSRTKMVFEISLKSNASGGDKSSSGQSALVQWSEVSQHPGIVCALTQSNNPVVLLVRPEVLQVHELKPLPAKSKIQGFVVVRQPTSPGESPSQHRTTMILLCEDGSLRIHLTGSADSILYWLQQQFQPSSPLACLSAHSMTKVSSFQKRGGAPKFPVDFFEHCNRMSNNEVDRLFITILSSGRVESEEEGSRIPVSPLLSLLALMFLGNDILHIYHKEQIKHRFNVGGLYIANTKPGGFTVEVCNQQSDTTVMVGVRVLLGCRSVERAPSFFEVFGRNIPVSFPGSARWFDMPFTREESLRADKTFKINFGPSLEPSGINMVDCIRVYSKTKDEFGWPEHPPAPSISAGRKAGQKGDKQDEGEVVQAAVSRSLSPVDRLVCNAFAVVGNYCLSPITQELKTSVASLISKATPLLMLNMPQSLQYNTKFLVAAMATDTSYHICKDHLLLSQSVQLFNDKNMEPDQFQRLLLVFLAITRARPQHLNLIETDLQCTLSSALKQEVTSAVPAQSTETVVEKTSVSGCVPIGEFIEQLNRLFWRYYEQRPKSSAVAPVCGVGLVAVETTVSVLTEIMWTFACLSEQHLSACVPHLVRLLTAVDCHISKACVRTLAKLLKPAHHHKPRSTSTKSLDEEKKEEPQQKEGGSEVQQAEEPSQQQADEQPREEERDEGQEPVLPPHPLLPQEFVNNPAAIAQLLNGHLNLVPDEEAMMNLAIALSLQEGGANAAQVLQGALQSLGLPGNVSVQIHENGGPDQQDEGEEEQDEEDDEEGDEEEEGAGEEAAGDPDEHSLTSSYEDLAAHRDAETPQCSDEEAVAKEKEGKGGQEVNSELEMANDSSGEDEPEVEDASFLASLSERLAKGDEEEEEEAKERAGSRGAIRSHDLRLQLLSSLLDHVHTVEEVGGARAIPYMQLILSLTNSLKCTHRDNQAHIALLNQFLTQLDLSGEDVTSIIQRSNKSELRLLMLRFLNILMSGRKGRSQGGKSKHPSTAHMLWFTTARTLLCNSQCMQFCLRVLKALVSSSVAFDSQEAAPLPMQGGKLLKAQSQVQLVDMGPFFQDQYVKSHSSDVFEAYTTLLADIVLALPCQLKKFSEKTELQPPLEFGEEWIETLCEYFMVAKNSGPGKKQVRKVLVYLCGSKEKYRIVRDKHILKTYLTKIRAVVLAAGYNLTISDTTPLHLSYNTLLTLVDQLKVCDEIASLRTANWQLFCLDEKNTLPFLFHISFVLDDGLAPRLLQLLHAAVSGTHRTEKEKEKETKKDGDGKSGDKEKEKENKTHEVSPETEQRCRELTCHLLKSFDENTLVKFIRCFLLQSNSSSVRWQAHAFLHCLYRYSSGEQVRLVQLFWQLWNDIPSYGRRASQFVDLLGYCTISTPELLEQEAVCQIVSEQAIQLLRKQNSKVASHPNAHVYSQLASLVDFDGYYLESEPCLVCNEPEIPYTNTKLYSIKSEVRYSPNTVFVKLVGAHMFAQLNIRISEIRRSKMIRTVNIYYSSRTVQNVIELKNKRSLWLKAHSCTLQPAQSELKVEFPLPIVARNIIVEYSDFYDNAQGMSEVLQCPRCNAAVPAHPGVCGSCGENVHQCHKCRAINYDERDPFLCNSCGFSKYARFELIAEVRSCSAVDPVDSEEDRQKTLSNINQLLEKADGVYKQLVTQRNDLDHLLVALASGATIRGGSSSLSNDSGVNRAIQVLAQLYCQNCKTSYQELSKTIQGVLASRRELVNYDMKKLRSSSAHGGNMASLTSEPATPVTPQPESLPAPSKLEGSHCFSCASATLEHCITLLKALAFRQQTRELVVKQNLIHELVEFNLHSGISQMQKDVQGLLCQLSRDNPTATCELNQFIEQRIMEHIKQPRTAPNLASAVQPEVQLLSASVSMQDSCWEQRLRTVISLFSNARSHKSPVVMAAVTMPCLRLLQALINPQSPTTAENKDKTTLELSSFSHIPSSIHTKVNDWLKGDPAVGFDQWKKKVLKEVGDRQPSSDMDPKQFKLAKKYSQIWKSKTIKPKAPAVVPENILHQVSWLRRMLFNPSSRAIRKTMCDMVYSLCKGDTRKQQILDLLSSFLGEVGVAGEAAHEFLDLFRKLTEDSDGQWKIYLSQTGLLQQVAILIEKEIIHLQKLEESTLNSDLSQGYALKMLTALLQSFLQVDFIKQQYKSQLVGTVLNGYLSLKRLVVQRTKKIDECQELLLQMLEALTTGTTEESMEFMTVCVDTLKGFPRSDMVTPIFVIERLCNIIHPEEEDVGEFYMSLDKDPQQEEFLQGRMQGNPYRSREAGLGPLMRDIKNKICTDCELVALLEDDTGMELLVCNKIISLDLPVKQVYKKIWCAQPNHGECMKVVYRMRGLLGDATEDMVEQLSDGKGEDIDEEEVFKMAAILSDCGGLEAILNRLAHVRDFVRSHELLAAALKLIGFCVKLKVNRQYLMRPHLNTLNTLLAILNLALKYEQQESNGLGASVAQQVLSVTEAILHEASSQQQVIARTISEEFSSTDGDKEEEEEEEEEESTLQALLSHIESPFVQSNLDVREGLMHIIPFLTFGDPRNMTVLLEHFAPYLNFEKFDTEKNPENALYLDCFCVVANEIGNDASGEKLKDLAIEMNLTPSALEYIKTKVPDKGTAGRLDTAEWKEFISQPSLPHILKMLRGLCQHHSKTQLMVCSVVEQLHLLEQVSSAERIGTLAENLLERLRDNPVCDEKIQEVRKATRTEKRRRAMAMRNKELQQLGMKVNEKGQVTMSKESPFKELERDIVEETGLKCCICLEGYKNQPQKILGVYTFTKKVTLDEFESKGRKTMGYSTVSHFNVVHYECHSAAVKLARGRDEWESATLQNANTRCNGILPIWGPEVSESAFASSLARHNGYLQECTGLYDASFRSYVHDLRLLLLRFAMEKSFSAESGGGGSQSNIHIIPYLMHVALYVVDTTRVYQREDKALNNIVSLPPSKWVSSAYELEGPLHGLVVSLFVYTLEQWKNNKIAFLRQLLVLAHARNISSTPIGSLPPPLEPAGYEVYKPMCILFALVDGLHQALKVSIKSTGKELPHALLEYIRNNDTAVLEHCDKLLSKYQEELLPAESFGEFCDVAGLLSVVDNPDVFLSNTIGSATQ